MKRNKRRASVSRCFVSSADVVEPLPDLPHDCVDFEWFQEGGFFFQLHTPFRQYSIVILFLLLVIAFINNLLDGYFPFLKSHRLFLFDCGIASCDFNRDVSMIEADWIAKLLCWHKLSLGACKARFPVSRWEVGRTIDLNSSSLCLNAVYLFRVSARLTALP